ncbi:unnamed protein product [Candidula unifasciata]|uniref:TIR domain-containing protein n=1 Tax=Candidula unifasciata TaxID=100452 RepID=A0A8S3ZFN4_9EUPU|nr:unnamed protein product [Candidula unifasciata]
MSHRKYASMTTTSAEIRFSILVTIMLSQFPPSVSMFFKTEINCSALCRCQDSALENTMKQYTLKHFLVMGGKYRPELNYFDARSEYMMFLGTLAPMLHRIVVITCDLSDGLSHSILSLLNGVDSQMDTSLEVKCHHGEVLIWDAPSWHTSFNIFASDHCTVISQDKQKPIIIPMNMWIMDIEKGGPNLVDIIDIRYIMNTVTLSLKGARAQSTPKRWTGKFLVSTSVISLQDNAIETFDCPMQLTKRLDTLNLDGNKLTHVPECVLNSQRIRLNYLSLARNLITELILLYDIPDHQNIPDIRIINLSFNQIRSVETLRDLGNLTVLDLSHNGIKDISVEAFEHLKNLQVLYLNDNKIYSLGLGVFNKNLKLRHIDLNNNFLVSFTPDELPRILRPITLDLSHNRLTQPPFKDCLTSVQGYLNVNLLSAENPYFCDCNMLDFEQCHRWAENSGVNKSRKLVFIDLDNLKCTGPPEFRGVNLNQLYFHNRCLIIDECPPMCSCEFLNVKHVIVNCSSKRLMEMPDSLPIIPNVTIALYMDHNPLQILSHRSYLRNLTELYADNCLLTSITPAAMAGLQNIRIMTLHNNMLQKLPSSTRNIILNHVTNLTLHNNRWACSCHSLWLPLWISKHKSSLWMPGNIVCNYLKKPLEELNEMDLNCNPTSYVDTFLAISLALSSVVSTLVIVICYRSEINVLLYSKLGLRLGYSFSYGDFFNPYDAFISYSQDNYRWVVDTLVPHLENGPKKYRLCLHYRDFPPGESVIDNLPWAIRLSRCAVLVLSKDFLKKEWCIMEVRTAFQRLLLVANRLIIIATDDINIDELSPDLRAYMNTHEYLRVGEPCFWDKLEMFLPPRASYKEPTTLSASLRQSAGDSLFQQTPDKFEETGISELSELSCRPAELQDHDI